MHEDRETDKVEVPLEALREMNELCDEFEARLRGGGGRPNLSAFVERAAAPVRGKLLYELVALCLEDAEATQRLLRVEGLAAAAPTLADDIRAAAESLTPGLRTPVYEPPDPDGLPPTTRLRKPSRGLRLRCPHCSNHVELLGDAPLDSVNCDTCGSNFSLVNNAAETRMAAALEKIDRFELLSRLGVGGFGTVWKARDTALERAVAVKIPRRGQLSSAEMEQFFREARSVAQLRHRNIVPVHEVGREGDTVFIVSDLVRGVSLADELSGHRFSPREAAQLCKKLAEALEHAHQAGVVHRDLKPSNVMIDAEGEPVLMDFGLAKREAEEVTMTTDGQIIGTPAYMSPEQAEGRSAWADRRTDVYSLGVILFELLTGELPFQGNAQRQVQVRLREEAPGIRSRNAHLPKDLATITAKCLERKPGQRYQSAADVAAELGRYLNNRPILERPVSRVERVTRWMQRNPLPSTIAGLILTLAVTGPTAALVINQQRIKLQRKYSENANLIVAGEQKNREALAELAELQSQLSVWQGKTDPGSFWPPQRDSSPMLQQMRSLLTTRRQELETPASSGLANAQRLLALATLAEGVDDRATARRCLQEAVEILDGDLPSDRERTSIELAVADAYERIAALIASDDHDTSIEWRRKALDLRKEQAERRPDDPRISVLLYDSVLRTALATGYDQATQQLAAVPPIDARLKELWPRTPAELYRIACQLAGREDWLSELVAEPVSAKADAVTAPTP